jgi:hypothetical protein
VFKWCRDAGVSTKKRCLLVRQNAGLHTLRLRHEDGEDRNGDNGIIGRLSAGTLVSRSMTMALSLIMIVRGGELQVEHQIYLDNLMLRFRSEAQKQM